MNNDIEKLIEKYGSWTDLELGEIPLLGEKATREEELLVTRYIDWLIEQLKRNMNMQIAKGSEAEELLR